MQGEHAGPGEGCQGRCHAGSSGCRAGGGRADGWFLHADRRPEHRSRPAPRQRPTWFGIRLDGSDPFETAADRAGASVVPALRRRAALQPRAALQRRAAQQPATDNKPPLGALRRQAERLGRRPDERLGRQPADRLPDRLAASITSLSGVAVDDVRVHRNSSRPAQLGAAAFTQDGSIYLGPGQEAELAHEAWHVTQQRQGRVPFTASHHGVAVNHDSALEHEADLAGHQAAHAAGLPTLAPKPSRAPTAPTALTGGPAGGAVVQGRWLIMEGEHGPGGFFWEHEDGKDPNENPPPTAWAKFAPLPSTPDPRTYRVVDADTGRAPRGLKLAYTAAKYVQIYGHSQRATGDVYNPFGRFTADHKTAAFLPALELHDRAALATAIKERDPRLEDIATCSPELSNGFPTQVITTTGKTLYQTQVNQMGALYVDTLPTVTKATAVPAAVGKVSDLRIVAPGPAVKIVTANSDHRNEPQDVGGQGAGPIAAGSDGLQRRRCGRERGLRGGRRPRLGVAASHRAQHGWSRRARTTARIQPGGRHQRVQHPDDRRRGVPQGRRRAIRPHRQAGGVRTAGRPGTTHRRHDSV